MQTGIDKLNEWSLRLGLGQKAGIELRESEPVLAGRAERRERGEYWGEARRSPRLSDSRIICFPRCRRRLLSR